MKRNFVARRQTVCSFCGHDSSDRPAKLDIPVLKGHVRRASRAADRVFAEAGSPGEVEDGLVLMTAILLVERLATSHACDHQRVLETIAQCFQLRDEALRSVTVASV